MGFYDYSVPATDGSEVSMKDYEGKVVLVVNTATGCASHLSMNRLKRCMRSIMTRDLKC